MSRASFKFQAALVATLLATLLATAPAMGEESGTGTPTRPGRLPIPEFTQATLDAASHIPVQDQGRVKPLSTYAAFTLLGLHHKRRFELPDGRGIKPTEWLLRTVLFPEEAMDDKVFRIEDSDVLDEIGLGAIKKNKRDLYSYNELKQGRRRLVDKYSQSMKTDSRRQTRDQKMLVTLAHKLFTFENVQRTFAFAETAVPARTAEQREQFDGRDAVPLSVALAKLQTVIGGGQLPEWAQGIAQMADMLGRESGPLRMMAPLNAEDGLRVDWYSVGDIVGSVFSDSKTAVADIAFLGKLEAVFDARGDAGGLEKAVEALQTDARARAESSNAYGKIDLEVYYHRFDAFFNALWFFFIPAFLILALSWFVPRNKWVMRSLWTFVLIGAGLITYGIVLRCILRGRPPVSTLYETILFITGVVVISALVIEWINKRRIGIAAAVMLGALGLFIAGKFEEIDRQDTMPQLLAVLDTNFWLATHVTCITIGYAAGLLAAAIAHVYVIGKAFHLKKGDPEFYRAVGRMVYGTLAFSLIFSVVGTILGGVWANDSWGRFWGWDPKENGALMIVLSQLTIIHARMGGYLKTFGFAMATILSGMVIGFSWWGVNLLGVGLHAYGFTAGLQEALNIFYLVESGVFVFAGSIWLYDRYIAPPPSAA